MQTSIVEHISNIYCCHFSITVLLITAFGNSSAEVFHLSTTHGPKNPPSHLIQSISIAGFINGLTFNADGTKLYVATGQEHRLGRWWRLKDARNQVVVVDVKIQSAASS